MIYHQHGGPPNGLDPTWWVERTIANCDQKGLWGSDLERDGDPPGWVVLHNVLAPEILYSPIGTAGRPLRIGPGS
jgi:hypothetical protein